MRGYKAAQDNTRGYRVLLVEGGWWLQGTGN